MSQLDKLAVLKDGALDAFGPAPRVLPRMRAVPAAQRVRAGSRRRRPERTA